MITNLIIALYFNAEDPYTIMGHLLFYRLLLSMIVVSLRRASYSRSRTPSLSLLFVSELHVCCSVLGS